MSAEPTNPSAGLHGWPAARPPEHRILVGQRVRLEPLDAARHAEDLFAAAQGAGADRELWRYMPYGPFVDADELRAWIAARASSRDPLFLAVIDGETGRAGGIVSYLRIEPAHGSIEIGHIWFGAGLQRTAGATEAFFLLARHAFVELGNRRLEWKCDADNARSRRAAHRLGFTFEGIFRQHQIVKGRNRDTAWFSMLDHEWQATGAAFELWLASENFDADERQRRSLASLR